MTKLPYEQTVLVCEYVARAKGLDAMRSTQSDFDAANALALQCMALLPSAIWERALKAVMAPTWQGALDFARDSRADTLPHDPLDMARHAVFHAPNAGRK